MNQLPESKYLRSEESERAFLGTILIYPNLLLGFKKVKPLMFANGMCKAIAVELFAMIIEKGTVELPILADSLTIENAFDTLMQFQAYSDRANITAIVQTIKEKYISRCEITLNQKSTNRIRGGHNAIEVIGQIQKERDDLLHELRFNEFSRLEKFRKVMDSVRKANESKDITFGIPTGYGDLDRFFSGWQKGNQIILAGRPGSGKTSMTLAILLLAAMMGKSVCFVSVEMPERQILIKLVCILTGLSYNELLGDLTPEQLKTSDAAFEYIYGLKFYIVSGVTRIDGIVDEVRLKNAKFNLDIVAVDYLQKIKGDLRISGRSYQIEAANQTLLELCGENDCDFALITLAQLSREVDKRKSKVPILSDLKDSGSIEQDGAAVVFIYRPEYYEIMKHPETGKDLTGIAYWIIAKNRLGDTGTLEFQFKAKNGTFLEKDSEIETANPFLKFPISTEAPF